MIGTSGLLEKTHMLSVSKVSNEVPSVPAQNVRVETDHPLVQSMWEMLENGIPETYAKEVACVPSTWCQKSTTQAADLRSLGNKSYNARNFDKAMMYYSLCVANAPVDSQELAAAYGNRSAIHMFRKDYELCLLDVNRALDGSLPQSTRMMLLKRKAMIWEKLQEQNVLRSKLRDGVSRVKHSDGEKANLRACERKLYYISEVGIDDVDLKIDHSLIDDPIWETKFDNTMSKNVSPKIELKYDDQLGPHLVAKNDIEPGETLYIDDLYTVIVHELWRLEYCGYCQVQCDALIACSNCTREMYCSNSCRENAYGLYHRIECKIWSNLPGSFGELHFLALRTFLRVTKQGSKLANMMNSPSVRKSLDGKLNCSNAFSSHDNSLLFANVVSRLRYSRYGDTIYSQNVISDTLAIFAALRYVQFFDNEEKETQCTGNVLNAQEYFGSLLLVFCATLVRTQMLPAVHRLVESLVEPYTVIHTTIGYCFNLWNCFTNHSCDPNTHRIENKKRTLVYSNRSIKAGDRITTVHGAHFTRCPRQVRRGLYKHDSGHECTCKACIENWPTLDVLENGNNNFRIRDKKKINEVERMSKWLDRKLLISISEDDLKIVLEFSKTVRRYVREPAAIIQQTENFIKEVMMFKGNVSVDPKYIASLYKDL